MALLSVISSVSVIDAIDSCRRELTENLEWLSKLNSAKQAFLDVEAAVNTRDVKESYSEWRRAVEDYHNRTFLFQGNSRTVHQVREYLDRVEDLLNDMERTVAAVKATPGGTSSPAVTRFHELHRRAIDELQAAIRSVWGRQSDIATELATRWRFLNLLVMVSCMLAILPALLYRSYQRDLSYREQAETALRESEQRYRSLVECSPDAICLHRNNRFLWVNPAALRLFGAEKEEDLIGREVTGLIHPDHRAAVVRRWQAIATLGVLPPFQHQLVRLDGEVIDVEAVSTASSYQNQPTVQSIIRDITEQKRAADALGASERRFRQLFANVLEGVYQSTIDGRILSANPSLIKMLGYETEDELKSVDVRRLIYLYPQERDALLGKLVDRGELRNEELLLRRKDGSTITVLENSRLVKDERTSVTYFEGTLVDITDRKRAEQELIRYTRQVEEASRRLAEQSEQLREQSRQLREARDAALQASQLKSEFLANVSHEIRTPMNGIIGMNRLLLETNMTLEQREYADTVRRSAAFLLQILSDILDFSKIEAGRLTLESVDFDLHAAVHDVLDLLSERAECKGIEIACFLPPELPSLTRGAPGRFRQVLTNLVGNAIKFTETGHVMVRGALLERAEDSLLVRFEVEDTGIGVPPDAIGRLFQPFSQVDGSSTRRYGGTGLGLAISKQLVEMMGGRIGVYSSPGVGSRFWFTARLLVAAGGADTVERPNLSGLRILLVDDTPAVRDSVAEMLRAVGAEASVAQNEGEAVHALSTAISNHEPYHYILVDTKVGDRPAAAIADRIRSEVSLATTRLVLLAAFGQRVNEIEAHEHGFVATLTKPVRLRALLPLFTREGKAQEGVERSLLHLEEQTRQVPESTCD
ncbi:MAG: PAS domain S-box protein, partial [Acidobacteria bacterium]|nr:PAS domain S-box protein [Acidobacteriota bacterium]